MSERLDEAIVVSLVKPNGRLIKHVKCPNKLTTKLTCETNTLRFSTRERVCFSVKRQIVQSDIEHKIQPRFNFTYHNGRNFLLFFSKW
jgi:YbbR domain-containing protein